MAEEMEQQCVTHALLLQHPGSCWNTGKTRERKHTTMAKSEGLHLVAGAHALASELR